MTAKTMRKKAPRISRDFQKFCVEQDKPSTTVERTRSELYFRAIGYSKRPVTEVDEQFAIEDLSLFFRGFRK